jgi:bifunctional non-homologous end joining protein LigD
VRKIFIDYLRNGKGASTIAAFSTRAKSALTVSMPVSWEELERVTRADQWTMRTAIERMQHLSVDPWDGYWTSRQRITAAMWRALNARPPSRK